MNLYDELRNAYGNHFQDLFSKLMIEKYGQQYKPTSTNGISGDLKVDGVLNFDTAFAVYAPEVYNDSKAIQKLKLDFNGFIALKKKGYWQGVQKYIFVIKRERSGITSNVLNLIEDLRMSFLVDILTMDDLRLIANGFLPFSEDGKLLQEFKTDVTEIMEYVRDTDFAAEPFRMSLSDEIELGILTKWNKKRYLFSNDNIENLKQHILQTFIELSHYLTFSYMHALSDGRLMFNNDSWEAGEKLRNELQPQTYKIRCKVRDLLEELYKIS